MTGGDDVSDDEQAGEIEDPGSIGGADRSSRHGRRSPIVVGALVLGVAALLVAGVRFLDYRDTHDRALAASESAAVAETQASAASVEELLDQIKGAVDDLASGLTDGSVDDGLAERLEAFDEGAPGPSEHCAGAYESGTEDVSRLEPALCAAALGIVELNGIGVVFEESYDPGTRYRPYANRIDGTLRLGELVNREFAAVDWYERAAADGGGWTHPRFGLTSQKLLSYYSAPFFDADGSVRGVVLATSALDRLGNDLRWLGVGSTGYSIILSEEGRVISHPSAALVERDFDDSATSSDPPTVAAFRAAIAADPDRQGLITGLDDDVTDAAAWLVYEPIAGIGWTFGAVIVDAEIDTRSPSETRLLIDVGIALAVGAFMLAVAAVAVRGGTRGLWILSVWGAVLALGGIAWIWMLTITGPVHLESDSGDDIASLVPDVATADEPLLAGVFVQSVEFTGSNDVTVSGIMWQEQRSDVVGVEPPGFVLPEADVATFTEAYRAKNGNLTRIGWSFTASLRQTFDYSKYPLDRETVWLRLWPADYSAPLLMLPELTSYDTIAPSTKPGVEQDFVVEGWELQASSFSYELNEYNTDFGLRDLAHNPTPELYFNVHLSRSFIDPLMSQLVPLGVVMILLFGVLLITRRTTVDGEDADFSPLSVLGYCAALFFVVILAHTNLRSKLSAESVIYLEYFYFTAYVAILLVSSNAILLGTDRGGRLVHHRDNLVPSLLFWPVVNLALLVVTLLSFY